MSKKVISIALILIMILELQAVVSLAQDSSADDGITENNGKYNFLSVLVSYFGDAPEKKEFMLCDDYVYADIRELSNRLGLVYEVSDEYMNSKKNNGQNNYIDEFKKGYTESFSDADPSSLEIRIRKQSSSLVFYFRPGSQNAFAYSMYFGKYCYDMGGPIIVNNGKIWVPLASFLYLVDSYCFTDEEKLNIGHSALTVIDILHRVGLEDYHFDIVDQFGEKKWIFWLKSQYNDYYKRVKNLIGGGFTFDFEKIKRTMTYDDIADVLSLQLYTANTSEIESLQNENKDIGLLSDAITALSDSVAGLSEAIATEAAFDAETSMSYFNSMLDNNYFCTIEDIQRAGKEASQAVQRSSHASAYNSIMSTTGNAITVVASLLSTYLTYITYIHEINEANKDYIPAVQKYIDYYSNSSVRGLNKDLMKLIRKRGDLYQNTENIFDNDELFSATASALATNTIKMETGMALAPVLPTVIATGLIATLGWDVSEGIVNHVSGGTFDHLDSAENTYYAMQLESDAEKILNLYKYSIIHENAYDFDTYRYLEWVRLKSYCIAREDAIQYSQRMLKKHPNEIGGIISEWKSEESVLNSLMSVLISGTHEGLTPEKIKHASEETDAMNIKLGEQVKQLTNIPNNAIDNMTPVVNAQISFFRFENKNTFYKTTCSTDSSFWGTLFAFCNSNIMPGNSAGIVLSQEGSIVIDRSGVIDLGYALFDDFDGNIPNTKFDEYSSIRYEEDEDIYKVWPASMHDYIYKGKSEPVYNDDGTITITYLYEESFWGNREGPETFAYDITFRLNDHVNKSSDNPYYYTIIGVEKLSETKKSEIKKSQIDIADYLTKPDDLVALLGMEKSVAESYKGFHGVEIELTEYSDNGRSLKICDNRSMFTNSGDPDIVVFGVEIGEDYSDVYDQLSEHGWVYDQEGSMTESGEKMYAFVNSIDGMSYILSIWFRGGICERWNIFNYYQEYTKADEEKLKKWFGIPSGISISDYSKNFPNYWDATNRWTVYTTIFLDDGEDCGAEVDPITYEPLRTISDYNGDHIQIGQEEDEQSQVEDEYILPDSNKRLLTEQDIDELDSEMLMLARNEIYARHGRLFKDESIQSYFNTKSWYKGVIPPDEFRQETLSEIEQTNAEFILKYENDKKGN